VGHRNISIVDEAKTLVLPIYGELYQIVDP
jgi:hypothetical protein